MASPDGGQGQILSPPRRVRDNANHNLIPPAALLTTGHPDPIKKIIHEQIRCLIPPYMDQPCDQHQ